MKKVLTALLLIGSVSFAQAPAKAPEKVLNLKLTITEVNQILGAIQTAENMSAKEASLLVYKIQSQAVDTTLNKK